MNDMMLTQEIKYKPLAIAYGPTKDQNMAAVVTIGFAKDAKYHIDIQGFNVYHKNRLIKPFWRVWNAAGSDGRGVIGVLEANFVEPAHDKQGFEYTIVLSRLEARLVLMQKNYWSANCHKIGYAKRRHLKKSLLPERESTTPVKSSPAKDAMGMVYCETPPRRSLHKACPISRDSRQECWSNGKTGQIPLRLCMEAATINGDGCSYADSKADMLIKFKEDNRNLLRDLQYERDRYNSLENEFQKALLKIEEMDKGQEAIINVFSEERERRDLEEENLRKRLKDASDTIGELLNKLKLLQIKSDISCKIER